MKDQPTATPTSTAYIDIDFFTALNDRTGKLFLGRDIVAALGGRAAQVRYGRFKHFPKRDVIRRTAGWLTHFETVVRVAHPILSAPLPRMNSNRPVLHLDPLSVVRHRLRPCDIVLCHDVGPITNPGCFAPGVDRLYRRAYGDIRTARPHMVFVSQASQSAFHGLFGHDFASSTVIHIPLRPGLRAGLEQAVARVPGKFILTVGSVGDRKNQARCITAFARSGLADQGWAYVITGGHEPGYSAVRDVADVTPGVILTGYVSEDRLRWLYGNAGGFVLMSLLEGFGMPVAEAAQSGLPCLVSDTGVLAEVGGPAMFTADPRDTAAITQGLQSLATLTSAERAARVAQARVHLQQFQSAPILQQWCDLVDRCAATTAQNERSKKYTPGQRMSALP